MQNVLLPLAESVSDFNWLHSMPWFAWVGIVAIVCGNVTGIVSCLIKHRERMAMIRAGMHPDAKANESKPYHPEGCEL